VYVCVCVCVHVRVCTLSYPLWHILAHVSWKGNSFITEFVAEGISIIQSVTRESSQAISPTA